jgi:RND family efflux transporter MFP subunit
MNLHRTLTPLLLGVGLLACGEPENSAAEAPAAEPAGGAITLWTDSTELFMEHPALIVGAPDKFAVHLTDISDFAPLRSGKITLTFRPRDGGSALTVVQESPRSPGIYGPSPSFERPGVYDLSILVDSPQARDSIFVPGLVVYVTAAAAPLDDGSEEEGVSFLKEQQWKTEGFRTAAVIEGVVEGSVEAPATLVPPSGRLATVSAPINGLIEATGVAASPVPGQRVSRGQILAVIAPSLGESGSAAVAEARARLREAEDELERARRLLQVEAVPARRVHEAEIRLDAAREALAAYGETEGGRVTVRTPISGVVVDRRLSPGARVDAGDPLFTVVDPSILWLQVNVPAQTIPSIARTSGAEFQVEGAATRARARNLVSVGAVVDSVSRTVPMLFAVENARGTYRVGANARAWVHTGTRERGLVVSTSAILEEEGRAFAWVQSGGELFVRRELSLGAREGDRVLVRAGLEAGERLVTGAAYQVRLASLSTAVPTHGHEH